MISAINEVSLSMLGGQDVDLRVDSVVETWALPVVAILGRYLMSVIVDSLSEGDEGGRGSEFWGV